MPFAPEEIDFLIEEHRKTPQINWRKVTKEFNAKFEGKILKSRPGERRPARTGPSLSTQRNRVPEIQDIRRQQGVLSSPSGPGTAKPPKKPGAGDKRKRDGSDDDDDDDDDDDADSDAQPTKQPKVTPGKGRGKKTRTILPPPTKPRVPADDEDDEDADDEAEEPGRKKRKTNKSKGSPPPTTPKGGRGRGGGRGGGRGAGRGATTRSRATKGK